MANSIVENGHQVKEVPGTGVKICGKCGRLLHVLKEVKCHPPDADKMGLRNVQSAVAK